MVRVMVFIGVHDEFPFDKEFEDMQLSHLPRIGDMIMPTAKIKEMISKQKIKWGMDETDSTYLNFVRTISYSADTQVPIIMLGANPDYHGVNLIYNNKSIYTYIKDFPKVADSFIFKPLSDKVLFVSEVCYYGGQSFTSIILKDKKSDLSVRVSNESINVKLDEPVKVSIDETLDVKAEVTNRVEITYDNSYPIWVNIEH